MPTPKKMSVRARLKEVGEINKELGDKAERAFRILGKIEAIVDTSMFGMVSSRVLKDLLKNG